MVAPGASSLSRTKTQKLVTELQQPSQVLTLSDKCSILEFRGDKVARETISFAEGWEAPDWRATGRAEWVDESAG